MDDKPTMHQHPPSTAMKQQSSFHEQLSAIHPPTQKMCSSRIYLHIADCKTRSQLEHDINKSGHDVVTITDSELLFSIAPDISSVLITDLNQAESNVVAMAIKSKVPVVFSSEKDSIETRLESVRANGACFLPLPSDSSLLSHLINRITTPPPSESYKILIIDDDVMLASFHEIALRRAKMETMKLHDPLHTLKMLERFKPDLILMDLYMPSCSGAELAHVIRQNEKYSGVPIVFISTESDIQEQVAAMEFGGDDFLLKPVTPERLVAAVSTRARRAAEANRSSARLKTIANELDNALISARSSEALKSRLIATMSHEVRTPINGMLGILDRILQSELNPEQKKLTEIVLSSTESLLVILNDTLDFSKLEAGKMSLEQIRFSLHNAVDEVDKLFSDAASSKGLTLKTTLSEDLPAFMIGDPVRLKQIIINLTNNAIKFTDSGTINIEVSVIESHVDQIRVLFNIIDSGIGMNEKQQQSIFNEYVQAEQSTSRTHGGTGLGLSICKKLVNIMGGEIGVNSTPNSGSTFWFSANFKVANQPEIEASKKDNVLVDYSSINPTVLIVEDNRVNQLIMSGYLQKHGIKTDIASNGKVATEKMINNHYQLVFMDCQMPIMDGYTATQQIRVNERQSGRSSTPVIAMTGNVLPGDKEKCKDAGMDDYLTKPVSKEHLATLLGEWLLLEAVNNSDR